MTRRMSLALVLSAAALIVVAGRRADVMLAAQAAAVAERPQAAAPAAALQTALDRYVAAPDPAYRCDVVGTIPGNGVTISVIDMTSQTWRAPSEVDRTLWKHWLTVIRPDEVKHSKAFLYITGGSNNNPAPRTADENLVRVANLTKSVVAELRMVPNQPLVFADEKRPRSEDEIIAYTWARFLKGGDDQWPLRLPMTKAAVRALDTTQSFCAGSGLTVDGFVVAGGSKRGWTTWATAAVDRRVMAIVPLVIDMLNIVPSFKHHFGVYGYYAPAVLDYEDMGIMDSLDTPRSKALMAIEEPYEYRQRLTMPKFIVNATGDQFFVPDSWQFYFDALQGEKYLRYVPNAEHSLRGSDAWFSVLAFYNAVITGRPVPRFTWKIEKDGTIRVRPEGTPGEVKLWQATNPAARDFRLTTIGPRWKATVMVPDGAGQYVARVAPPKRGYTAFMVELTFPSGVPLAPFKFTTGVKVVPDVEPFKGWRPDGK